MKSALSILAIALIFLLTGCPSAPPAKPGVVTPAVKAPQTPVAAQTVPNALTEADFAPAQKAIDEAIAAHAERYSPTLLARARAELAQAKTDAATNPTQAKALLTNSVTDANSARDDANAARKAAYTARLDRARQLVIDQNGDKYYPADFQAADALRKTAEDELNQNVEKGVPLADEALKPMVALYEKVTQNVSKATTQRDAARAALSSADKNQAFVWAPDLLQTANDSFLQGLTAFKRYQLETATEDWAQAKFQADQASAAATQESEKKNAEDLMIATMKKIEQASQATVVTPDDQIVGPKPWNGQKALQAVPPAASSPVAPATPAPSAPPAPAPSTTPAPSVAPAPSTAPPKSSASAPVSELLPKEGTTAVLAEKSRLSYLEDAKATWEQGVAQLKAKNYVLASQLFLEAQRMVDIYMTLAVDKLYTVRLIPEHRDSLWRISGYQNIYNNPFDWPKIWKRNQKLIQNPDLIYPGWQLIIPPQ
jgi:nucleoid-associated protein YgaU